MCVCVCLFLCAVCVCVYVHVCVYSVHVCVLFHLRCIGLEVGDRSAVVPSELPLADDALFPLQLLHTT